MPQNYRFEITDLGRHIEFHRLLPQPILLYVLSGEAEVNINLRATHRAAHCLTVATGQSILRLMSASPDFRAALIEIDSDIFAEIAAENPNLLSFGAHASFCNIDGDAQNVLESLISAIEHCQWMGEGNSCFEMHCLHAICAAADRIAALNLSASSPTAERYLQQFIALMFSHVATEHEVRFYASQLDITPKYLNELSQRRLGISAKDAISTLLTALIRHDLLSRDSNIKALASKYNFCDQSSLGKFFKKETGMSPNTFLTAISG